MEHRSVATQPLEAALDDLRPAVAAVRQRLDAMQPDEVSVEFGIVLGAETGVVVAKGTTEVHFTVTLTWKAEQSSAPLRGQDISASTSS